MPQNRQTRSNPAPTAPIAGRSINADDFQAVPRPLAAMAKDYPDGWVNDWHRHARAQLVYASSGVMAITTREGSWVVPPNRALWIPAGIDHHIVMSGPVTMRTLYIAAEAASGLPRTCRVVAVSPLLRELILRAVELPVLYDDAGPAGRIVAMIFDELHVLPTVPLHLPSPRDARLDRLCRALRAHPADARTLDEWGAAVGASARTLARAFVKETGMSFAAWRAQVRLLAALARLASGEKVTSVALDLGYDSPSAFIAMFRRQLGVTPSRYFAAEKRSGSASAAD